MRARKVNENEFHRRSKDLTKSLGLGDYRFKIGDEIILNVDLSLGGSVIKKGTILRYISIDNAYAAFPREIFQSDGGYEFKLSEIIEKPEWWTRVNENTFHRGDDLKKSLDIGKEREEVMKYNNLFAKALYRIEMDPHVSTEDIKLYLAQEFDLDFDDEDLVNAVYDAEYENRMNNDMMYEFKRETDIKKALNIGIDDDIYNDAWDFAYNYWDNGHNMDIDDMILWVSEEKDLSPTSPTVIKAVNDAYNDHVEENPELYEHTDFKRTGDIRTSLDVGLSKTQLIIDEIKQDIIKQYNGEEKTNIEIIKDLNHGAYLKIAIKAWPQWTLPFHDIKFDYKHMHWHTTVQSGFQTHRESGETAYQYVLDFLDGAKYNKENAKNEFALYDRGTAKNFIKFIDIYGKDTYTGREEIYDYDINESMDFKKSKSITKGLDVGKYRNRPFEKGDKVFLRPNALELYSSNSKLNINGTGPGAEVNPDWVADIKNIDISNPYTVFSVNDPDDDNDIIVDLIIPTLNYRLEINDYMLSHMPNDTSEF